MILILLWLLGAPLHQTTCHLGLGQAFGPVSG